MRLGNVYLGWSRNVAVGFIWTRDGKWSVLLLGLCAANFGAPAPKEKPE